MQEFKLLFVIYSPVYIYTAIVLYLIALVSLSTSASTQPSLSVFQQHSKTTAVRILYILTLASMLGTPPTIGFFAKVLTFYLLVQKINIALAASIILTLILIIFYLQTIRTANVLRRKITWHSTFNRTANELKLIYGQFALLLFTVSIPYVFDIMYCFFI